MKLNKTQMKKIQEHVMAICAIYDDVTGKEFPVGTRVRRRDCPDDDMDNCFRIVGHNLPDCVYFGPNHKVSPDKGFGSIRMRRLDKTGKRVFGDVLTSHFSYFWSYYKRMD